MGPSLTRKVLIVGLGIAGMTAAKQLAESGWAVTIVERSPARRQGGHVVALFPTGCTSAERIGILDALPSRAGRGSSTWQVNRKGQARPGLNLATLPGAPRMLLRSDVEKALFNVLPESVDIRFSTTPERIIQLSKGAEVKLASATDKTTTERFDLVLGADGVRSTVRRLVFGPDANFVHNLGYMIGAAQMNTNVTGYPYSDSVMLSELGRTAMTVAYANCGPTVLFSYRTVDAQAELNKRPSEALQAAFGPKPFGHVLNELLEGYASAGHQWLDIAQQVRMKQWHFGRVALVGDAAWCMTPYTGLGASASIAGAELLVRTLTAHGDDVSSALSDWNTRMHPFVDYQHRRIEQSRALVVAGYRKELIKQYMMIRLMSHQPVAKVIGQAMSRNTTLATRHTDLAVL